MSITEKTFTCKRNNLTIRGMMCLPDGFREDQKYPCVIASHGFTDNYTGMANWCRDFADIGYAAFCFSFCGDGKASDEEGLRSDGKSTDMTISTQIADLQTVISFVKKQPFIDADDLTLLGASQGGFVSGLTAARCGDEIRNLIMIFPAFCIPDDARGGRLGGSSYDPANVPEIIDCGRTLLGRAFHEDVVRMDPYLETAPYAGPVLIIQGLDDETVDPSYAVRAKESYREGQCHLLLVENMGHGYTEEQRRSAFAAMRQFLADKK